MPEDITIPETCPVLGIPIIVGGDCKDNLPSVDRIDNLNGYVKHNIVIVSWRANRIKSDAKMIELETIAKFYRELERHSCSK